VEAEAAAALSYRDQALLDLVFVKVGEYSRRLRNYNRAVWRLAHCHLQVLLAEPYHPAGSPVAACPVRRRIPLGPDPPVLQAPYPEAAQAALSSSADPEALNWAVKCPAALLVWHP
jgi:hypothetical protein